MGQRTRIRGRGTIDWPERTDLHGCKCFIIGTTPDGRWLVKMRREGTDTIGELARVPKERVRIDPP